LPPAACQLVLKEARPLGAILNGEAIPFLSWPQAFFRLKADVHTGAALGLRRSGFLYGRRNVLLDGSRRLLAEVIEVLAPAAKVQLRADWRELKPLSAAIKPSKTIANHRSLKPIW
jgi:hypothetical protein